MSVANPIQGYIVPRLQVASMTADQIHTQSSEVMEDVTELVHAVPANTRFYFICTIRLTSPTNADIDVTFAAIANTDYTGFHSGTTIKNPIAFATERMETTDGTLEQIQYYGMLKTGSTAGSLQFQFAQTTAQASNTTIHEGSSLMLYTLD